MGISIQNITASSATFYYSGTSIDSVYQKDIDWYLGGSYVGSTVIPAGNMGSNGCWVYSLSSNTSYSVRANITWYSGGGGTKSETASFRTEKIYPSINSLKVDNETKTSVRGVMSASNASRYDFHIHYGRERNVGGHVTGVDGISNNYYTFNGLSPGVEYVVRAKCYSKDGVASDAWERNADTLPPTKPVITEFNVTNITPNSVDLSVDSKNGTRYKFTVQQKYNTQKEWTTETTNKKVTLSGLTPLTEHYAYVKAWSDDNVEELWKREFTTAKLVQVVIKEVTATPTRNSVWVVVKAENASIYDYKLYEGDTSSGATPIATKVGVVASEISFNGLKANKKYCVNVTAKNSGHAVAWDRKFTTLDNPRPLDWWWSDGARRAFSGTPKGYTDEVNHTEWNNFVTRVSEFYLWYWNTTSEADQMKLLEKAIINPVDKILYANKFNYVRAAIGSMNSTGMSDFKAGDEVKGSFFLTLEQKMNETKTPKAILEESYIQPTEEEAKELYAELFQQARDDRREAYGLTPLRPAIIPVLRGAKQLLSKE